VSTELTLCSRRVFVIRTVRAGLGGALVVGVGLVLERAGIAAKRMRHRGRTRKSVDSSTSTSSTNNETNVSVAIGEPGAPGPSVEIDR
jgi:hypothetical protein